MNSVSSILSTLWQRTPLPPGEEATMRHAPIVIGLLNGATLFFWGLILLIAALLGKEVLPVALPLLGFLVIPLVADIAFYLITLTVIQQVTLLARTPAGRQLLWLQIKSVLRLATTQLTPSAHALRQRLLHWRVAIPQPKQQHWLSRRTQRVFPTLV